MKMRAEIDTLAPFESVKEAASRFGGIGFWKPNSHKPSESSEKREKRRWLFRRPSFTNYNIQQCEATSTGPPMNPNSLGAEQRHHAIAVAAATKAAAEAAVATAQAAVEIIRLTSSTLVWEHKHYYSAAIVIQTAFRGHLSRASHPLSVYGTEEFDRNFHFLLDRHLH